MCEITLCIINHNGAAHLRHAFAALAAQHWRFAEVLIVDDASTDDSLEVVARLCPHARVLRLERNAGPGAARNAGAAAASHDLILFQDNDVRLEADTVALLFEDLAAHPEALAVAPRVLDAVEPSRVHFDSADCHFLGLMATRHAGAELDALDDAAAETTSLVTTCFLIDRARWQGNGPLFDESFGFNLEDHDFGVRACLTGHRLRVHPRARVLHGGGTPGLSYRPGFRPSEDRQFYLTRNRWVLVLKCFSARTLLVLAPALFFFEVLQLAWLAGQGRASVWRRAVGSLWHRRRALAAERRAVQGSRRVRDGAVLRGGPLPVTPFVREGGVGRIAVRLANGLLHLYWRGAARWIA